jgi:hypothetical protein
MLSVLPPCCPACLQFGAKVGGAFGKVMFGSDAAAAAEELNSGLQWLEAELAKSEGPLFMGQDLSLVSGCIRVAAAVAGGMPAAAGGMPAAAGGMLAAADIVCLQQKRMGACSSSKGPMQLGRMLVQQQSQPAAAVRLAEGESNKTRHHTRRMHMCGSMTCVLCRAVWCMQVDAAIAPFVLRLRVLEGLSGYKVPSGNATNLTHSHMCLDAAGLLALRVHPTHCTIRALQHTPGCPLAGRCSQPQRSRIESRLHLHCPNCCVIVC